ncbi:hypothetical protein BE20_02820 [Sorangium cellulosum]|nr:hypothetical protein BE20_02820 [Sorangium cellulosum]
MLMAQGDLGGARRALERSLAIDAKVHGTEEHPSVAASLHAATLRERGGRWSARATSSGTEEHPAVAASLHELGSVLRAQGDLVGGTEEHPAVAVSLHELGGVLREQGDLAECTARRSTPR